MEWQPDVIVVGAGAAGLNAARLLTRSGKLVLILDARRRIGGRIHTLHDPLSPVPIELGAEFIHGRPPEIFDAVAAGRLAVSEIGRESYLLRDGKPEPAGERFQRVDGVLKELDTAPEQSFQQFIGRATTDPEVRRWATDYVEGFNAARQDRISVRALAQMQQASDRIDGERAYRLHGGYGELVEWLWSGVDSEKARMHLGAVVDSISWRRGHVEVTARAFGSAARFEAARAILTVPLGVLHAAPGSPGAIRFDPDPPALAAARKSMEMGHAIRVVLRFRRPVWEDREDLRDPAFLFSDSEWIPTWWTTHPVRSGVITGWAGGSKADRLPSADPADWVAGALRTLARVLATDAASLTADLEAWHTYDWSGDPFARGAYSYVCVGGLDAQRRLCDPVEDTLYFAGEAVNCEGHVGTVHGAMASGARAALQIP